MSRAEHALEYLCELTIAYVIVFQAIGLLNLVSGVPTFTRLTVLIAAAFTLTAWWLYRKPRLSVAPIAKTALAIPLAILAGTYFLFLMDAVTSYPNGYDALAYHLQQPLSWMQTGTMRLTETTWRMALPSNAELFTLPALALDLPSLAFTGNMVAMLMLAISVYLLGLRFSGSRDGGIFGMLIALSIPVVLFQTFYLNVDITGSAFLFASIALLLRFMDDGRSRSAVLFALCLGVSMGTKHIYIAFGVPVALAAIVLLFRTRRAVLVPVLIASFLAPSALWVSRNWMATGNPLYPFGVRIGGLTLRNANQFPPFEVRPSVAGPGISRLASSRSVLNEDRGFGPAFAVFGLAALLSACLESLRRRCFALTAMTGTLIVLCIVWWTSLHVFRFGLPLFITISMFSAILYARLTVGHRAVAKWLLIFCTGMGCVLCLAVPLHRVIARIRLHDWSRTTYYGYPPIVDQLPKGARILDRTRGTRLGFVLCGARLQNQVVHLDGTFTAHSLSRVRFEYVAKDGMWDAEDTYFAAHGELMYEGTPRSLFPAAQSLWRVYRSKSGTAGQPGAGPVAR